MMVTAVITAEKIKSAGGYRYKQARRPELYRDIIGSTFQQKVSWLDPRSHKAKITLSIKFNRKAAIFLQVLGSSESLHFFTGL
jgi:hypothetical protein